jgi:hypothetical protein
MHVGVRQSGCVHVGDTQAKKMKISANAELSETRVCVCVCEREFVCFLVSCSSESEGVEMAGEERIL